MASARADARPSASEMRRSSARRVKSIRRRTRSPNESSETWRSQMLGKQAGRLRESRKTHLRWRPGCAIRTNQSCSEDLRPESTSTHRLPTYDPMSFFSLRTCLKRSTLTNALAGKPTATTVPERRIKRYPARDRSWPLGRGRGAHLLGECIAERVRNQPHQQRPRLRECRMSGKPPRQHVDPPAACGPRPSSVTLSIASTSIALSAFCPLA